MMRGLYLSVKSSCEVQSALQGEMDHLGACKSRSLTEVSVTPWFLAPKYANRAKNSFPPCFYPIRLIGFMKQKLSSSSGLSPCRFGQKIRDLGFFGEIPAFNSFRQLTAPEICELIAEKACFRQLMSPPKLPKSKTWPKRQKYEACLLCHLT